MNTNMTVAQLRQLITNLRAEYEAEPESKEVFDLFIEALEEEIAVREWTDESEVPYSEEAFRDEISSQPMPVWLKTSLDEKAMRKQSIAFAQLGNSQDSYGFDACARVRIVDIKKTMGGDVILITWGKKLGIATRFSEDSTTRVDPRATLYCTIARKAPEGVETPSEAWALFGF